MSWLEWFGGTLVNLSKYFAWPLFQSVNHALTDVFLVLMTSYKMIVSKFFQRKDMATIKYDLPRMGTSDGFDAEEDVTNEPAAVDHSAADDSLNSVNDREETSYESCVLEMTPCEQNENMCERLYFQILLLGDAGVGKTSFIQRYCDKCMSMKLKSMQLDNQLITFLMWDHASQESLIEHNNNNTSNTIGTIDRRPLLQFYRFRNVNNEYLRKVDCVIIMFDVTSGKSFESVERWLEVLKEFFAQTTKI
ncbi:hypothetical protein HELRODRAFT_184378 [Helobdella robusta]|uniref:Uncharacterized protein n=1 Tax=Helobdella robusta TaxID=6412 RepID=T1FL32_HELRO|nr:hypothetical protein HELRODRAFT_184378 [Helobdella robusta]ESN99886.1 hypothetical protein HELRODRAFT_184378 [Helobdella robusta]